MLIDRLEMVAYIEFRLFGHAILEDVAMNLLQYLTLIFEQFKLTASVPNAQTDRQTDSGHANSRRMMSNVIRNKITLFVRLILRL